jgi:hypothetical protein
MATAEETRFKKGQKSGPGRPKGLPNKTTVQLKDMILKALDDAGGAEYLERRANDPRTAAAFLALIGKVLPMQVTGVDGGAVQQHIRVTFEGARD